MNERELTRLDQVIGSQAEIKAQLVALTKQMERMNGSVVAHFAEDKRWMEAHDLAQAKAAGVIEGKANVRKSDMALLGFIAGGLPMLGYAVVFLLR